MIKYNLSANYIAGYCSCIGSGDPHYYTPDGADIHFMGTCKYTLWKSTIPNDKCKFRVETKNEIRSSNTEVSYTRMIDVYAGGYKVRVLKGGNVLVSNLSINAYYFKLYKMKTKNVEN